MIEQRPHTHRFLYLRTEKREGSIGREFDPLTDEFVQEVRGEIIEDIFYCETCLRYERVVLAPANIVANGM
jgi:hypothetical protein